MAGVRGKYMAKTVVVMHWVLLGGGTLTVLTLFSFIFGKLYETNRTLEVFRTKYNDKRISELKEQMQDAIDLLIFYSAIIAVSILVQALLNTLLTVGVYKSSQRKLGAWLVLNVIRMCIGMYYFVQKLNGRRIDDLDVFAHLFEFILIGGSLLAVNYFRTGLIISSGDTDTDSPSQEENPDKVIVMKV